MLESVVLKNWAAALVIHAAPCAAAGGVGLRFGVVARGCVAAQEIVADDRITGFVEYAAAAAVCPICQTVDVSVRGVALKRVAFKRRTARIVVKPATATLVGGDRVGEKLAGRDRGAAGAVVQAAAAGRFVSLKCNIPDRRAQRMGDIDAAASLRCVVGHGHSSQSHLRGDIDAAAIGCCCITAHAAGNKGRGRQGVEAAAVGRTTVSDTAVFHRERAEVVNAAAVGRTAVSATAVFHRERAEVVNAATIVACCAADRAVVDGECAGAIYAAAIMTCCAADRAVVDGECAGAIYAAAIAARRAADQAVVDGQRTRIVNAAAIVARRAACDVAIIHDQRAGIVNAAAIDTATIIVPDTVQGELG